MPTYSLVLYFAIVCLQSNVFLTEPSNCIGKHLECLPVVIKSSTFKLTPQLVQAPKEVEYAKCEDHNLFDSFELRKACRL